MTRKTLLTLFPALCLALLLTSCLEEDGGLYPDFEFTNLTGHLQPDEAARTGTGMPKVAYLENFTYTDSDKVERTVGLGHVEVTFQNCADGWCDARVDDCYLLSNVAFNYVDNAGAKTLSFDRHANSEAVKYWAGDKIPFAFARDGVNITLTCTDCPGTSRTGEAYTDRTVTLRAVR